MGDKLDVPVKALRDHLDLLAGREGVSLNPAVDALKVGDDHPRMGLTFADDCTEIHVCSTWI